MAKFYTDEERYQINLLRGVIVDKEDLDFLKNYIWSMSNNGYFYKSGSNNTKIYLHKLIAERMGLDTSIETDHRDLNKKNNRRSNLRQSSHSQNNQNQNKRKDNTSGHKNVHFDKRTKLWFVRVTSNKNVSACKYFKDKLDAAEFAYLARLVFHGEFANHG